MKIIDKEPTLFEKSENNIWTDPYIQQQMLENHLDLLPDRASRSQESILKTTNFILAHTKPGNCLLDLGCGPGLYTSLLADEKYIVTGVDFNKASIEYATGKRKDINYKLADYINNFPVEKYDVITMIYCDMGTHPDTDRNQMKCATSGSPLLVGSVKRSVQTIGGKSHHLQSKNEYLCILKSENNES